MLHTPTSPQVTIRRKQTVALDTAGATSVGKERSRNEDQFLIATLERHLHVHASSLGEDGLPGAAEGTLLIVADGMGGHAGGEVASRVAVRAVAECICSVIPWFDAAHPPRARQDSLPGMREGLSYAVAASDREVRRAGTQGDGSPDMGTTLTIAYVRFPRAYVAHVGDSRCYHWQKGQIHRLTRDHTLAEQLRDQVGEQAESATAFQNVLWNALGGGATIEARPDLDRVILAPDDALLLCSDGLTKHVDDERIAAILAGAKSAEETCEQLVAEANAGGGSDNITAVVARFVARDEAATGR
jgi:protein phosphatase